MAKLKVYRTPAGFHDAYVAAPSQKAALAAWGSDADLFARGIAEVVTDPELIREPLEKPGEVIRRMRTMPDEPETPPEKKRVAKVKAAKARKPKPSRAALDAAEAALSAAETRHAEERQALKREEEALAARRRALDKAQNAERVALDRARIAARDDHDAALAAWREG